MQVLDIKRSLALILHQFVSDFGGVVRPGRDVVRVGHLDFGGVVTPGQDIVRVGHL